MAKNRLMVYKLKTIDFFHNIIYNRVHHIYIKEK